MAEIAIIGTKGGWSSEKLADAAEEMTGKRMIVEMSKVRLDLNTGDAWFNGSNLASMDALIIKKIGARYSPDLLDRLELLRFLSMRGVRIFSAPENIIRVLDRLSCTVTLKSDGIPMPPTTITEDVDEALIAIKEYKEAVLKPLYTSKARGMILVNTNVEPRAVLEAYKKENTIIYIQKRIHINDQDLGVVFLGGKYLTTYARRKQDNGSWNTTTVSGGKYAPYDPSPEIIELAQRAQDLFGLDFTCVDVAITDQGPFVFEVSAFGGFRGILETRAIDPAKCYVDYVLKRIGHAG
ncbi:MAG: GAK system ATP-grasp enzyme [Desulfobacteraceae bacterium]|nr:GAK system ATP-grasp enzyme [Desulfobacteraceae bacterium]MBC2754378.1 GAK system ATP-grasp enzyme [Desulfobacteraceae bacterium]